MNKKNLIKEIAKTTGYPQKSIGEVLEAFTAVVTNTLAIGVDVTLPGFGKFVAADQAARTCTNPRTGEKVQVAAKKTPKFRASSVLKSAVAGA